MDHRSDAKTLILAVVRELHEEAKLGYDADRVPLAKRKAVSKKSIVERLAAMKALGSNAVLKRRPLEGGIDFNEGKGRPNSITADLAALVAEDRLVLAVGGFAPAVVFGSANDDDADDGQEAA